MPHPEQNRIPAWAEQERSGDLHWIGENLHIFWPVAQTGVENPTGPLSQKLTVPKVD
jgi:hypothetical protein